MILSMQWPPNLHGISQPDIGALQIESNNENPLCLESARSFSIHDKMNIQFGVRKNNIYYPRSKIESVFNGTIDNNNSGLTSDFL